MGRTFAEAPKADWPFHMRDANEARVEAVRRGIDAAVAASQFGWGHEIDFGPFVQRGLLGTTWRAVVAALDEKAMWPTDLTGLTVADVGAFTGGISALMAHRGASRVYAVDELPGHVLQTLVVKEAFELGAIDVVESSLYQLDEHVESESLDLILLSGVLYHLSDMLVGLYDLRRLLRPGGRLVIETNAVEDAEHSYANFGRYYAGMWWQPSMLCVQDMLGFMGFEQIRVEPFVESRCIATAVRSDGDIPYKRGLNFEFSNRDDAADRPLDTRVMRPAPPSGGQTPSLSPLQRLVKRIARIP